MASCLQGRNIMVEGWVEESCSAGAEEKGRAGTKMYLLLFRSCLQPGPTANSTFC